MTATTESINAIPSSSSSRLASTNNARVEILEMELAMNADFSLSSSKRSSSPPPLDEVTVYSSCTENEDSSTCSSVSSDELLLESESSPAAAPRSIFQSYWKNHSRPTPPLEQESNQDYECSLKSSNNYEEEEQEERPASSINRRRRRIFSDVGCSSSSSSQQHQVPEEVQSLVGALRMSEVRKTKSAPGLVVRPGASCLRQGSKSARRRSDSSVTFSNQVDVVYFERPKETWASGGWSKFFSS